MLYRLQTSLFRRLSRVSTVPKIAYVTATGAGTFTFPSDFQSVGAYVECRGAGGSGGAAGATYDAQSAGGGAYSRTNNLSAYKAGDSVAVNVGAGGASVSSTSYVNGNPGGDTWFGNSVYASAICGAKGGSRGVYASPYSYCLGGQASAGIGDVKFSGGAGGFSTDTSSTRWRGAGGAAGPSGDGANGATNGASGGNGGAGNNGVGGSGGTGASTGKAGNGGNGTDLDATHGSGGGGGMVAYASSSNTGGDGGNYGGGGGGAEASGLSLATSGKGGNGLIAVVYYPYI